MVRSDRRVVLDAPPDQVWAVLEGVERYQVWWPWLENLDADGLVDGARWQATVRPPLRYRVSFEVELRDVAAPFSIAADITGDICGSATISFHPTDRGRATDLHFVAELRPAQRLLVALTRLAPPVARAGHDHIIDHALAQFEVQLRA